MSAHLQRAVVLVDQSRFEDAVGELHLHLGQHTDDAIGHALLSRCFLEMEKFDEATEHAQQAIASNPEEAIGHETLARVMLKRNRYREARESIDEALQLAPYDPDLFGLLSVWHFSKRNWSDALAAANQGLELDPEDNMCLNLRSQALVMLGDKLSAAETIEGALRRNPDDPLTHANHGWAMLDANNPLKAAEHFREALRLDPTNEWARAGMVEALKARNWIYRGMLAFFMKAAKWPSHWQMGFMIGGLLFSQRVASMAQTYPSWAGILWAIFGIYLLFAVMTWISSPMFNLLLRFDRFGKHCLSNDDRAGANVLGIVLGTALLAFVTGLAASDADVSSSMLYLAFYVGISSIPVSCIYQCESGWPRRTMAFVSGYIVVAGAALCLPIALLRVVFEMPVLWKLLNGLRVIPWGYAFIGSQFLGAYLQNVEVKK